MGGSNEHRRATPADDAGRPIVVVVGAGDTGARLAHRLAQRWAPVLVDPDADALGSSLVPPEATTFAGDGTSALVLRRAGAERAQAIVAATGSDEVNLEVLRVAASELGLQRRFALVRDHAWEERYREAGVERVNLHAACTALIESRLQQHKMATEIGLGTGEIVEVTILPTSSVIGKRLAEMHPRRWLVGAVYRDGQLVVPHGDTMLAEGDRVLLIGDPKILPAIATHMRSGDPQFPLHYGSNIVAMCTGDLPPLADELKYLRRSTSARGLVALTPGRAETLRSVQQRCEQLGEEIEGVTAQEGSPRALAVAAARHDAGLVVLSAPRLPFFARIGLQRTRLARLLDECAAPVLVARGSFPYRRVMLLLAEMPFDPSVSHLALDVVRTLGLPLQLGVVHQPELVGGSQLRAEIEAERERVSKLAALYDEPLAVVETEGNPIARSVELAAQCDLLVLPYRRGRRASLLAPDVAQAVIHLAPCSTLAMPC